MKRLLLTCTDLMAIQFLVPHVKYLSQNGFSVELACSAVGGRMDELRQALQGVAEVRQVHLVRSPFSPGNRRGYGELKGIIDGQRWDVIWTNEPVMGVMTRLAARDARKRGTKVVYMVHGFHFYHGAPARNWLLYYPVERYCSRLCDMIITINQEDFQRAKTFHANRVEKIPGVGVNLDRFAPNESVRQEWRRKLGLAKDDIALLTVGELHKGKNQQCVIKAIGRLNNPHIHYILCGKGEEHDSLYRLSTRCGIAGQVHFLGYRKDVAEIMLACDMFVFMSLREGLSRALMEAMASGMPVVCSSIRGNIDLIGNGSSGFVVPNDPEYVAEAVSRLAKNPELRTNMGVHNAGAAKKYDICEIEKDVCALMNFNEKL